MKQPADKAAVVKSVDFRAEPMEGPGLLVWSPADSLGA